MKRIFAAAEVPVTWEPQYVGIEADERTNSMVTRENLDSVLVRNRFASADCLDVRYSNCGGYVAVSAPAEGPPATNNNPTINC